MKEKMDYIIPVEHDHVYDMGSSISYVGKIFRKLNISYPLLRSHTCAYQGEKKVSFSETFAYVLNGWPL